MEEAFRVCFCAEIMHRQPSLPLCAMRGELGSVQKRIHQLGVRLSNAQKTQSFVWRRDMSIEDEVCVRESIDLWLGYKIEFRCRHFFHACVPWFIVRYSCCYFRMRLSCGYCSQSLTLRTRAILNEEDTARKPFSTVWKKQNKGKRKTRSSMNTLRISGYESFASETKSKKQIWLRVGQSVLTPRPISLNLYPFHSNCDRLYNCDRL